MRLTLQHVLALADALHYLLSSPIPTQLFGHQAAGEVQCAAGIYIHPCGASQRSGIEASQVGYHDGAHQSKEKRASHARQSGEDTGQSD